MKKLYINLLDQFLPKLITIAGFTILVLMHGTNQAFAQNSPWLSAEVNTNSIYSLNPGEKILFNYSASIMIAENIGKNKVSFGFEYSTFDIYYIYFYDSVNNPYTLEYQTIYFNFPIIYTHKFKLSNKFDVGPYAGFTFSIPYKSKYIYSENDNSLEEHDLIKENKRKLRIGLRTGAALYYHINRRLDIFCNLYSDLILTDIKDNPRQKIAPSSSAAGFGFGLEYNWR